MVTLRPLPYLLFILSFFHIPVEGQVFEWVSTYKSEGANSGISGIVTDGLGNVYHSGVFIGTLEIGGFTLTTAGYDQDTYVAKYDAAGNFLWVRHLGGNQHQSIYALTVTSDDHVIATGSFQSQMSIDGFTLKESPDVFDFADSFLLKFAPDGTVVMASNIGFSEDNMADQGFGVTLDAVGNIYVAGGKGRSMYFLKTNATGETVWRKTFGSTNQVGTISAGPITIDKTGNIFVSGLSGTTGYLLKIDNEGKTIWTQSFQGHVSDLEVDSQDQLLVSGNFSSPTTLGGYTSQGPSGIIGKMNTSGSFVWQKEIPSFRTRSVSISATNDQIYFTGAVTGDVVFGRISKLVKGSSDLLIGALSKDGLFSWVAQVGEENGENGDLLDTDRFGNIFITNKIRKDSVGLFQCQTKTGESKQDIYVAKITPFVMVPILGPLELCPDEEGSFSYIPVSAYIDYVWKIDAIELQTSPVDETSILVKSSTSGVYEISIETPVDLGCENFVINHSVPMMVTALVEKPEVSGVNEVCAGATNVAFTVTPPAGTLQDNTWKLPDDAVIVNSSEEELVLAFSDTFSGGEIIYTREGKCNIKSSDPFLVTSRPKPGPAMPIQGDEVLCSGTDGNLFTVDPIAHADTYRWSVTTDGYTRWEESTTNFISVSFQENADHADISVEGYNKCGMAASPSFPVELKHKPKKLSHLVGPAESCSGDDIFLETQPTEQVYAYHWHLTNTKNEMIINDTIPESHLNLPFTGPVVGSVSAINMCGEGDALSFIIEEILDPEFIPEISRNCDLLSYAHNEELYWFKDDVLLGSEKTFKVYEPGLYELRFVGRCTTRSSTVRVEEGDISKFIPNIFTPNGDGKNEYFEISPFLQGSALRIFNRWGKEVYNSIGYQNQWDGEFLPSGVYFYNLRSKCSAEILKGTVTILK